MLVHLRGVCEAVAARDRISVNPPSPVTPSAIAGAVTEAIGHPSLRTALFHDDSSLRTTTRVLDGRGREVAPTIHVAGTAATVVAVLPCDG